MNSKLVRQYFTQDLSHEEKKSYLKYINGDETSTDWIDKSLVRREPLLCSLVDEKCGISLGNGILCQGWINAKENGICKCTFGHDCTNLIILAIGRIMSGGKDNIKI
jgi:hypothetical protein